MTTNRLVRFLLPSLPSPDDIDLRPVKFKPHQEWKPRSDAAKRAADRRRGWVEAVLPTFHRNFLFELREQGYPLTEAAVRKLCARAGRRLYRSADVAGWLAGTSLPGDRHREKLGHALGVSDGALLDDNYSQIRSQAREIYREIAAGKVRRDREAIEIDARLARLREVLLNPKRSAYGRIGLAFLEQALKLA